MIRPHRWLIVLVPLALLALPAAEVSAQPCLAATEACAELFPVPGTDAGLTVYRTHPLGERNDTITRAVLLVHGAGRNASDQFDTLLAGALIAGTLDDTLLIAPRFASNHESCGDALAQNELNWDCGANRSGGWRTGSPGISHPQTTTFDATDALLRRLADPEVFPNLTAITVAGFSAGGQFVNRYSMVNRVHDTLRVPVHYVVASPSSYAYPDAYRPTTGGAFALYADAANCSGYDRWPYGLSELTGYAAGSSMRDLREQLASRPITYLVGELESRDAPALDTSCPAMAQGASRLARAEAYVDYVTEKFGATRRFEVIGQCGHSARCVYTAGNALRVLYPPR
jgi:hypothetical protein